MRNIEAFMVTHRDVEGNEYPELVLYIGDMDNDFFTVTGFDNATEAYEFAEVMANALGVKQDFVLGDVWDVEPNPEPGKPILTRIK